MPEAFTEWILSLDASPMVIMICILISYAILGMFMDAIGMLLLTLPVVYPAVTALGFDSIWFGIIVLIVVEVGLITPPVGMNLFVINSMDRKTPMIETYKSVMFFVGSDIVRVIILVLFPSITLFLLPG